MDKLGAAGCDRVFREKLSGTTDRRPQLWECMRYLREGDTLIISRLDRLARSTLHPHQIAEQLKQEGVELLVLDQAIDTWTPTGRLLLSMLGAIAEFETELRRERQMGRTYHGASKFYPAGRSQKRHLDQLGRNEAFSI